MIDPNVPQSLVFLRNVEKEPENMKVPWLSYLIRWWIFYRRKSKCTVKRCWTFHVKGVDWDGRKKPSGNAGIIII